MIIWKRNPTWCFDGDDGADGKGGGGQGNPPQTIKVGDKEYTPEQITALEQTAGVGGKLGSLAQRYGVDPDNFLQYSENSLAIVAELQSKGMLDEEGNLKIPSGTPPASPPAGTPPGANPVGGNKEFAAAMEKINQINERFERVESGVSNLYKKTISDSLKQAYPSFEDSDVEFVAREATRSKRPIDEVAAAHHKAVVSKTEAIEKGIMEKLGKKYNLNFDDLNKVAELRQDGGITPATVTGGKKLSFKGGKDTISPGQALRDYMKQKQMVQ